MKHVEMIIDYIVDGDDFQYCDNHGSLIRCKDCRYYQLHDKNDLDDYLGACDIHELSIVGADDFCSFAERKEQ